MKYFAGWIGVIFCIYVAVSMLFSCLIGTPMYLAPAKVSGMPPGWIIQENEATGKYRWCSPFPIPPIMYCTMFSKNSKEEAMADAWSMVEYKKNRDAENRGWK